MKLIIFDAYGTLISTGTGSLDATKKILDLQDKKINPEKFYTKWKRFHRINMDASNRGAFLNEEAIFALDLKQLYAEYDIERDPKIDVQIMLNTLGKRWCFEETIAALKEVKNMYRVVIGSTTDTNPLYMDLERNGISVDAVYTSEMIGKYKPDPDFYRYILEKEKCKADSAVFVGDSYIDDVYGPGLVGIKSILIDRKRSFQSESKEVVPWKITYSLQNIKKLVDEMSVNFKIVLN